MNSLEVRHLLDVADLVLTLASPYAAADGKLDDALVDLEAAIERLQEAAGKGES